MKLRRDNWYQADEGKYFVLTEKGKANSASYRDKTVGEPVDEYDTEAVRWAVDKGYLVEVSIPDWIEKEGYQVVYDINGRTLSVGNPIVFPERELAEKYMERHKKLPTKYGRVYCTGYSDVKMYIATAIFKGRKLKDCREYDGRKVYNRDWYYGPYALAVGDLVEEDIVDDIINALPPACMRSDCVQLGEPAGMMALGEDDKLYNTYVTFKRVSGGIFEYCGECFRGKNIEPSREV